MEQDCTLRMGFVSGSALTMIAEIMDHFYCDPSGYECRCQNNKCDLVKVLTSWSTTGTIEKHACPPAKVPCYRERSLNGRNLSQPFFYRTLNRLQFYRNQEGHKQNFLLNALQSPAYLYSLKRRDEVANQSQTFDSLFWMSRMRISKKKFQFRTDVIMVCH